MRLSIFNLFANLLLGLFALSQCISALNNDNSTNSTNASEDASIPVTMSSEMLEFVSTNSTVEADEGDGGGGNGVVTMASEMPEFVSAGPMPNRTKEITISYTLTWGGYFQIGSPATETIRLALNRLSKMPNWLPGYNLRFELIEDLNANEVAIPSLVHKVRNASNNSWFPLALLTETTAPAQVIPATFLKEFNITSLTIYQNSMELAKRQADLTNFIGLGPKVDFQHLCLGALFKKMNWQKVSLITEIAPFWDGVSFLFKKN